MSYSKLGAQVKVGDYVWRRGQFWLVEGITAGLDQILCFQLRAFTDERDTWSYHANYDLAVAAPGEVRASDWCT